MAGAREKEAENGEKRHRGPTLDGFLEEESVLAETQAKAIRTEVIAWQLGEAMRQ